MIGKNMREVLLPRPSSLATTWLRIASAALLAASSWVAAPIVFAQASPTTAQPPPAATPAQGTATTPPAQGEPAAPPTDASPGSAAASDAASPVPVPAPAGGDATGGDATAAPAADTRGLDTEVQGLKKDVVDLNRELFVLEEELLFPANTQVAVFLSMDVGDFFALDTVTLKIDQKEVINYLYTPREVEALLKGGVHRLYLGNLKVGKHELVAFFSGKGPNDRAYKRGATLKFEKGIGAKYLELKNNDRQRRQQPEFEIKDWE
jgi:hypothetical protein